MLLVRFMRSNDSYAITKNNEQRRGSRYIWLRGSTFKIEEGVHNDDDDNVLVCAVPFRRCQKETDVKVDVTSFSLFFMQYLLSRKVYFMFVY